MKLMKLEVGSVDQTSPGIGVTRDRYRKRQKRRDNNPWRYTRGQRSARLMFTHLFEYRDSGLYNCKKRIKENNLDFLAA